MAHHPLLFLIYVCARNCPLAVFIGLMLHSVQLKIPGTNRLHGPGFEVLHIGAVTGPWTKNLCHDFFPVHFMKLCICSYVVLLGVAGVFVSRVSV